MECPARKVRSVLHTGLEVVIPLANTLRRMSNASEPDSSESPDYEPTDPNVGSPSSDSRPSPVSSGLSGLDSLLGGGFVSCQSYQVRGKPGAGKTILGWHFLAAAKEDETALLITFDESADQLRVNSRQMGIPLESVDLLDLSPTSHQFPDEGSPDSFYSSELSIGPIADKITSRMEEAAPSRIVVDSITHFRHFSESRDQERQYISALLRYLASQGATTLLLSRLEEENQLPYLTDGVVEIDRGETKRTIRVVKQRGQGFREGRHPMTIGSDGMKVHPHLQPTGRPQTEQVGKAPDMLSSGVPGIDELLGGGLEKPSVTLISGASGVGKSTLGLQFIAEAAGRGDQSVLFAFEEETQMILRRSGQVNLPVQEMVDQKTLTIHQPRPWSFDPGHFSERIQHEVEDRGAEIVMIDSVGSFHKCGEYEQQRDQLLRLCKYMISQGTSVLLTDEIQDITGTFRATDEKVSHLADNLIFLRYLELKGTLRKAIGILKKRAGTFEKTLREFQITPYGIKVGDPLTELRGVLTGNPQLLEDESSTPRRE